MLNCLQRDFGSSPLAMSMINSKSALLLLASIIVLRRQVRRSPFLARLLFAPPVPSRETVILPEDERVVLLGASSGVGRDLAIAYAKRGAKMYVGCRVIVWMFTI
jgi:hypothetical protein